MQNLKLLKYNRSIESHFNTDVNSFRGATFDHLFFKDLVISLTILLNLRLISCIVFIILLVWYVHSSL